MAQVLDPDKSLSNAVKRIIAWIAAAGGEVPSPDTGAYSKARNRFSERGLATSGSRNSRILRAHRADGPTVVWTSGAGAGRNHIADE